MRRPLHGKTGLRAIGGSGFRDRCPERSGMDRPADIMDFADVVRKVTRAAVRDNDSRLLVVSG
jgi:hypothetical protein